MGEQMHGWILYILSVKWTNKANFVRWFHPFWIGAVSIPHHLHHHQLCKLSTHLFAPFAQTCPHKYTYIHIQNPSKSITACCYSRFGMMYQRENWWETNLHIFSRKFHPHRFEFSSVYKTLCWKVCQQSVVFGKSFLSIRSSLMFDLTTETYTTR